MHLEMLAIGDELLSGTTTETNSAEVGLWLLENAGLRVCRKLCVADRREEIVGALREITKRGTQLLIVFGGLGPTTDDCTAEAAAEFLGVGLGDHEPSRKQLLHHFSEARPPRTQAHRERSLRQVRIPENSYAVLNPVGFAPAWVSKYEQTVMVFLPGVPSEMRALWPLCWEVVQKQTAVHPEVSKQIWRCIHGAEAELQTLLLDVEKRLGGAGWVAYRARPPEVFVELYSRMGSDQEELNNVVASAISDLLAPYCYGRGEATLEKRVVEQALQMQGRLAFAESCTGGLVQQRLSQIPGVSEVLWGGVVCYQNHAKEVLLNCHPHSRDEAMSAACTKQLAQVLYAQSRPTLAAAITGHLPPASGESQVPLGSVFTCVAIQDRVFEKEFRLHVRKNSAWDTSQARLLTQNQAATLLLYEVFKAQEAL